MCSEFVFCAHEIQFAVILGAPLCTWPLVEGVWIAYVNCLHGELTGFRGIHLGRDVLPFDLVYTIEEIRMHDVRLCACLVTK